MEPACAASPPIRLSAPHDILFRCRMTYVSRGVRASTSRLSAFPLSSSVCAEPAVIRGRPLMWLVRLKTKTVEPGAVAPGHVVGDQRRRFSEDAATEAKPVRIAKMLAGSGVETIPNATGMSPGELELRNITVHP